MSPPALGRDMSKSTLLREVLNDKAYCYPIVYDDRRSASEKQVEYQQAPSKNEKNDEECSNHSKRRRLDITGKKEFGSKKEFEALVKFLFSSNDINLVGKYIDKDTNATNHNNFRSSCQSPQFCITELILNQVGIGSDGAKFLSSYLKESGRDCTYNDDNSNKRRESSLVELHLQRNGIGTEGGKSIFHALTTNNTLAKLDLSLNDLKGGGTRKKRKDSSGNDDEYGGHAAQAISDALAVNTCLRELILVRSALGPLGGSLLAPGLAINRFLLKLDLTGNDLMALGGHAIGIALQKNSTLQDLNLRWNRIGCGKGGSEAIHTITDTFSMKPLISCLQRLDMSVNELYCEGAKAFAAALSNNNIKEPSCPLLELNLERNEIGSKGAKAIGDALRKNTNLRRLILSGNPNIGDEGGSAIFSSLVVAATTNNESKNNTNSSLEEIQMMNCNLGVKTASVIGQLLEIQSSNNSNLSVLNLSRNQLGPDGGEAIARGMMIHKDNIESSSTLIKILKLSHNRIGDVGGQAFAIALHQQTRCSLLHTLDLSNNEIEIIPLMSQYMTFLLVTTTSETIDKYCHHIVASIARHPSLKVVDLSSNAITTVPMESQLILGNYCNSSLSTALPSQPSYLQLNLGNNPLSSPPLGRRGFPSTLRDYLSLLVREGSTDVSRIRLMVLGFGGVGKSTFCNAITSEHPEQFHDSLIPLEEWDNDSIVSWAEKLGTNWAQIAATSIFARHQITGRDLPKLVIHECDSSSGSSYPTSSSQVQQDSRSNSDDFVNSGGNGYTPTELLRELCYNEDRSTILAPLHQQSLARAIGSLIRKGYFSTVGAIEVEGVLSLGDGRNKRECSIVDFAGQMEYLVSHQLLLSSLHTLCIVLQPAPSFLDPQSRHYGSWSYWSKFLRALGDRREGSLILAISQLDKVTKNIPILSEKDDNDRTLVNSAITKEIEKIYRERQSSLKNHQSRSHDSLQMEETTTPLELDYRPSLILNTIEKVLRTLSLAADVVAKDWYVPTSYEQLSQLVNKLGEKKKSNSELPILSRQELLDELKKQSCLSTNPSFPLLSRMYKDPQLLQRGIEYLEAVGDVMTDERLGDDCCLLLDPIGWFASFMAHFIRDENVVTSIQLDAKRLVKRGVVRLSDVAVALQHEYSNARDPKKQIFQIMSLVCHLELCIRHQSDTNSENNNKDESDNDPQFLFPCLLPMAEQEEVSNCWKEALASPESNNVRFGCHYSQELLSTRGHRFRSNFLPPGLFSGLLSRCCRNFHNRGVRKQQLWKDCAIFSFFTGIVMMMRVHIEEGILDVIAMTPGTKAEGLFVGAAKGQASIVIWMTHLIRTFLKEGYPQVVFEEMFLCPSPKCHNIIINSDSPQSSSKPTKNKKLSSNYYYKGDEFPVRVTKHFRGRHNCEADGCWSFLGTGHMLEPMVLIDNNQRLCRNCNQEASFALRSNDFVCKHKL